MIIDTTFKLDYLDMRKVPDTEDLGLMFKKRYYRLLRNRDTIINMTLDHMRPDVNMSFDRINSGGFLETCPPQLQKRIIAETFKTRFSRLSNFFNNNPNWRSDTEAIMFQNEIMRRLQGEVFPPGHRIIERGRFVTHLHFIIDGKVTLSYIDSQRYEHDIATLSNGSFYGEHQILLGIKSLFRLRVPPNGKTVTQI